MTEGRKQTKPRAKKRQPAKNKKNEQKNEILNIIGLFIGLYLIASMFIPGSGGAIGAFFVGVFRAFFGIGAFLIPFAIGASYFYRIIKKVFYQKTSFLLALFVLTLTFFHMINAPHVTVTDVFEYNMTTYFVLNGGVIGAILGNAIHTLFGFVGATILVLAAGIILVVILTKRSFGDILTNSYGSVKQKVDTKNKAVSEHAATAENKKSKLKSIAKEVISEDKKEIAAKILEEEMNQPVFETEPQERRIDFFEPSKSKSNVTEQTVKVPRTLNKQSETPRFVLPGENISKNNAMNDDMNDMEETHPSVHSEHAETSPQVTKQEIFYQGHPTENSNAEATPTKASNPSSENGFEENFEIKFLNEEEKSPPAINKEELEEFNRSKVNAQYIFPRTDILSHPPATNESLNKSLIYENTRKLEQTLKDFGVVAKVVEVSKGPTVTRYELTPGTGVKVSKISGLADDLALNLAAKGIRIEAPIPGKSAVGIEIPNDISEAVYFRELIESETFQSFPSNLAFAMGKDIAGGVVVTDLAKMPHLLIAGATGSGKSVCINTIIVSLLYKASPEAVKLIMIDPKVVELSVYNGIPHLLIPVVTDPKKAAGALNWAVREMLKRYEMFQESGARNLESYNKGLIEQDIEPIPQIVIIIDELADLMMAAPGEVEDSICRLAQMARAAGLHLIIATQRPSVDVITGLIKANVPSRLAFSVSSGTDSRTILDTVGAEKLLGRGDMLFAPIGVRKPMRIQGAFISDKEVENIVNSLKDSYQVNYEASMIEDITSTKGRSLSKNEDTDEFFEAAVDLIIEKQKASTSMLQRQFRIGYQRASRLIEFIESQGIIGPEDGAKPRKVLLTRTSWEEMRNAIEE